MDDGRHPIEHKCGAVACVAAPFPRYVDFSTSFPADTITSPVPVLLPVAKLKPSEKNGLQVRGSAPLLQTDQVLEIHAERESADHL
jgi:hypothetical protein